MIPAYIVNPELCRHLTSPQCQSYLSSPQDLAHQPTVIKLFTKTFLVFLVITIPRNKFLLTKHSLQLQFKISSFLRVLILIFIKNVGPRRYWIWRKNYQKVLILQTKISFPRIWLISSMTIMCKGTLLLSRSKQRFLDCYF